MNESCRPIQLNISLDAKSQNQLPSKRKDNQDITTSLNVTETVLIRQQPMKGKAIGFTQQFGNFLYELILYFLILIVCRNPMLILQLNSQYVPRPLFLF